MHDHVRHAFVQELLLARSADTPAARWTAMERARRPDPAPGGQRSMTRSAPKRTDAPAGKKPMSWLHLGVVVAITHGCPDTTRLEDAPCLGVPRPSRW
jgi:hypothetical protein